MSISLIDAKESFKTVAVGPYNHFRGVMNFIKKFINEQVSKSDKTRISEGEAIAIISTMISMIDYLEKYYTDKNKPNENGFNNALKSWEKDNS